MEKRKGDYYDAIREQEMFLEALKTIDDLREDSRWMSLHELVDQIFRKTGENYIKTIAGTRRRRATFLHGHACR